MRKKFLITAILCIILAFAGGCSCGTSGGNNNGNNGNVAVTGVTLNKASTSIVLAQTEQLTATVNPTNATDKTVFWSSNSNSVASVSATGLVTANSIGTAIITVRTSDGNYTDTCTVTVVEGYVAVEGVNIASTSANIMVSQQLSISYTVLPAIATNKDVTWLSDNPSVATVDDGVVTGVAEGTATITVKTVDGEFTDTITINVTALKVTGVRLDKTEAHVAPGGTITLTATISPDNAPDKSVTWSSDDESVATVVDGVVTGVAEGTAIITVTTTDGAKKATCTIIVTNQNATTASINYPPFTLIIFDNGDMGTQQLKVITDGVYESITWSSDDSNIVKVDQTGKVTAVAKGTTIIKATVTVKGSSTPLVAQVEISVRPESIEI